MLAGISLDEIILIQFFSSFLGRGLKESNQSCIATEIVTCVSFFCRYCFVCT